MGVTKRRNLAGGVLLVLMTGALARAATAGPNGRLIVTVFDSDGRPVPEVAVYALRDESKQAAPTAYVASGSAQSRAAGVTQSPAESSVAVMDQRNRAFVPHILVIETGTTVEFPNSDNYLHHVYSFSSPKPFQLPLYGGLERPALQFDAPGLVTLGCNIHDGMLGYILVVDTPYFGITDSTGQAELTGVPAGDYRVETWTPRLRPDRLPPATKQTIVAGTAAELTVHIESRLRPPHLHSATSLTWDDY